MFKVIALSTLQKKENVARKPTKKYGAYTLLILGRLLINNIKVKSTGISLNLIKFAESPLLKVEP
tara:strand:+ start:255 stop:449 length:195 start_codon:yes stop_codon:yes gene_type:complete